VARTESETASAPRVKPLLRGYLHEYAFFVFVLLGVALALAAPTSRARLAAVIFAACVVSMLGTSALYHRVNWRLGPRRWLRRLDHAMIFLLIAGTYTPFGLLVLSGNWRVVVLAIVWSGALTAIVLRMIWIRAPKWLDALVAVALGWVGIFAFPQIFDKIGVFGTMLLLAGGILYTVGAVVYARRKPDPFPTVFGYHEIFHALVIAAVACQYASVTFFVVLRA
jgi:hemolysin III